MNQGVRGHRWKTALWEACWQPSATVGRCQRGICCGQPTCLPRAAFQPTTANMPPMSCFPPMTSSQATSKAKQGLAGTCAPGLPAEAPAAVPRRAACPRARRPERTLRRPRRVRARAAGQRRLSTRGTGRRPWAPDGTASPGSQSAGRSGAPLQGRQGAARRTSTRACYHRLGRTAGMALAAGCPWVLASQLQGAAAPTRRAACLC